MPNDDRYVLRHEFESRAGKLHARINDVDNKHMGLHNDLKLIITNLSNNTENLNKSSERTNKILESIDTKMDGYNDRINNVERTVEKTTSRVDSIENNLTERQKGNVQIILALIGFAGVIATGAFSIAHLFF